MKKTLLDKLMAGVLCAAIVFTILAHGAVEPWSVAIFELLILFLIVLWAIKSLSDGNLTVKLPVTCLPIAAFLVVGIIQSFSKTGENGLITSLSFDTEATRNTVKILFFLLVSHITAVNFFNDESKIKSLVRFLVVFGSVVAVFGIIQYLTWNGNLYWLKPAGGASKGIIGPFLNHNHFAGMMELIIPLAVAQLLFSNNVRERILYGFAAAIMTIAAIASLSRGGMISLCGGLLFIAAACMFYSIRRRKYLQPNARQKGKIIEPRAKWSFLSNQGAIILVIGAALFGTILIGAKPVSDRLLNNNILSENEKAESLESSRIWIWRNSAKLFINHPVSGVGLGAFETVYPQYSEGRKSRMIVDRAHNDYLQVLTDTGIIGGAIALWFICTVLWAIARGLSLRDPWRASLSIGIGGAIVSLMIHSFFDFNLQIPAIALLFLVLLAVLINLPPGSGFISRSGDNKI